MDGRRRCGRDIDKPNRTFDRRPESNPRPPYSQGHINGRYHKERDGCRDSTSIRANVTACAARDDRAYCPNRYNYNRESRYLYCAAGFRTTLYRYS